jgi:hypothetical protein
VICSPTLLRHTFPHFRETSDERRFERRTERHQCVKIVERFQVLNVLEVDSGSQRAM